MEQPSREAVARDAEHRLQTLERQLEVIRVELAHQERLATLGTLAAGVAHEVNNILTPALGYARLARSRPEDLRIQKKAIDATIIGIESAARILESILGFSVVPSTDRMADIERSLTAAVNCLARDPAADRIEIQRRLRPGLLVAIEPLALQQVLLNLLINACRALRPRGGQIIIASEAMPGRRCRLLVADDGPGIPPELAASIFEPFVSGPAAAAPSDDGASDGGSGLGLAVCRRVIESAGGAISATITPGGGATFRIELPLADSSATARAG